jgi:hypothetical protein
MVLFSFIRMANKMLFSNRSFIHRPPMNSRSAISQAIEPEPKSAR